MLNWFVALTKGPFALLVILGHDSYAEILVSRTDLVELAPARPRNFSEAYNLFDGSEDSKSCQVACILCQLKNTMRGSSSNSH